MTNSQAIVQLDKSEEYFVVELKKKTYAGASPFSRGFLDCIDPLARGY